VHVHPQLVALAADREEAVQRPRAFLPDTFDARFAVGWQALVRLRFAHPVESLFVFQDMASACEGKLQRLAPSGHRFIDLVHTPLAKQRLVGVAVLRAFAEQYQAGGFAVDAVQRAQVGTAQLRLQPHQQRFAHIASARRHGQKMRLVGHDQMRVFKQHSGFKRNRIFVGQLAPVVHPCTAHIGRIRRQWLAVFAEHTARAHALGPFASADARQALGQVVDQRRPGALAHAGQGHAAGRDAIAHRNVRIFGHMGHGSGAGHSRAGARS